MDGAGGAAFVAHATYIAIIIVALMYMHHIRIVLVCWSIVCLSGWRDEVLGKDWQVKFSFINYLLVQ